LTFFFFEEWDGLDWLQDDEESPLIYQELNKLGVNEPEQFENWKKIMRILWCFKEIVFFTITYPIYKGLTNESEANEECWKIIEYNIEDLRNYITEYTSNEKE